MAVASKFHDLPLTMTFLTIVVRGLFRRPVRTGLTLFGIAIGIAAFVMLIGISRGFEKSWQTGLKARGTDIVVSNMGGGLTPKPFNAEVRDQIAKVPRVKGTCALLVEFTNIEDSDIMMLSAREWGGFIWNNLKVVSGRMPRDGMEPAVVLGETAAQLLKKKAGDTIQIEATEMTVAGIVRGGAFVEDGAVIMSLALYQSVSGNEGKINAVDVSVDQSLNEAGVQEVCDEINRAVPHVRAVAISHHLSDSQGFRMIKAMTWGTSLLAVIVGVLGIMNTMLMTVFERRQEIGVLLAIGWKRSRVLSLILLESALIGFLGGIAGVILGVLGERLLREAPMVRGFLEPDMSASLLLVSLGVALVVGILSGLYPAWRSSQVTPASAMQG